MEAFGLENRIKGWAERAVIVMDQEPQGLFSVGKFPNQLPGLLRNPDLIGVGGDTSKMDAARPQFNEEKHVYGLKKDSFHCEEITRQDLLFLVGHQMTPTNGAPSEAWRFSQGESPCRTRPNQPFVPSVAVMKEVAKVGLRSNRLIEKTSALKKGCQRLQ